MTAPVTEAVAVATADPLPAPRPRPETDTAAAGTISPAPANAAPAPTIASLVGANSIFALDGAVEQGDASSDEDETSSIVPASTRVAGWKIQIAAAPSQSQAEDLLDRALGQASKVLRTASPYTEPVTTKGATLYRARFAGFRNQAAARAACAYLTKRDFDCLAVSD
jgi:hypothetical protein